MSVKTDSELAAQAEEIKDETSVGANTAVRVGTMLEDFNDSKATKEFHRTFVEALVFDKNEIFHTPINLTGDITFTIGANPLVDQVSAMQLRFTTDGTHTINFGPGFDFLYGITNGEVVSSGTYELYFLYTNGSVSVNFPGTSAESSLGVTLSPPDNFVAVADGETALDLSWDNVTNNSGYVVEFSLTGTGGWSVLETTAADAVASTQTGLAPGDTRYYRIKTLGDGVNFFDSAYSGVISGQTESSGDVTAPTFTFLPANGNNTWTVNRPITITANEPIRNTDGSEITNANVATRITLKETNSGGANIAFTASIDGTKQVITITPTTQYGEAQLVYVAINNVEDVNGNEVTVAVSITFTTTDFTFFDGAANRLIFGDILDSVFAAADTNFWLEITVKDLLLSGTRILAGKSSSGDNQRSFYWYFTGTDVYFIWFRLVTGNVRQIKWAGALSAGEHTLVLKYDGSIDTNDGLDRVTLLVDGGTAGSKTLEIGSAEGGGVMADIANATAQLSVGILVTSAGTPTGSGWLSGEAKDFIVRSTAGATVEINVPNLKTGTDTSGNSRNGTWV